MTNSPYAIVLMGVSGCGKTSVGLELSNRLGWPFYDGDDFHPEENVSKMADGHPLDDADRVPWLANLHDLIENHLTEGQSILLACSALKQSYRDQLAAGNPGIRFVYLQGDFELIFNRMQSRSGHYMKAEMLQSQFKDLEPPEKALIVNIHQQVEEIAALITASLDLE